MSLYPLFGDALLRSAAARRWPRFTLAAAKLRANQSGSSETSKLKALPLGGHVCRRGQSSRKGLSDVV